MSTLTVLIMRSTKVIVSVMKEASKGKIFNAY